MKMFLFPLAWMAAAGTAWAQSFAAPGLAEGPGYKDLAWAAAALVLVLVLLTLVLKVLQRFGRFRGGRGRLFEIRGFQPLDNRKYLAAVAVDGRLLVLGVTPDRLIPLGQWLLREGADGPDAAADDRRDFKLPDGDELPDPSGFEGTRL